MILQVELGSSGWRLVLLMVWFTKERITKARAKELLDAKGKATARQGTTNDRQGTANVPRQELLGY